jgi:aconitate hydratase
MIQPSSLGRNRADAGALPGFEGVRYIDLQSVFGSDLDRMPLTHRLLAENFLRSRKMASVESCASGFLEWLMAGSTKREITFAPSRILMHDTTCGPALVDIATMRDAVAQAGGDPNLLNPEIPVATSTDHSVGMDVTGRPDALALNMARELQRNAERYRFMKWASQTVRGFDVFPPGSGIMHTINMERLATVVDLRRSGDELWAMPDTLVGTDSHTPMINAMGVLGWGVGGIEAEGAMFGVTISLRIPDVVGVRLVGSLPEGTWATDLALVVTAALRKHGAAEAFVEFFGPGVGVLSVGQRAAVANMAPEYGATTGFFPIDIRTLDYLGQTGRSDEQTRLVEAYARAQRLWYDPQSNVRYTDIVEIDLSAIGPTLAGPRRPHDQITPAQTAAALSAAPDVATHDGEPPPDAVAIAAITSCTNTTDTGLLVAAGLVARKARELGLTASTWVKTSLSPGSPATKARLEHAGVMGDLEAMGFSIAGYGCATCIGNSGPLQPEMQRAVKRRELQPVAILSGNRNFPGRVHAQIDDAFLASPPLVVAFAIAGRAGLDITTDVLAFTPEGVAVRLADLWPTQAEVEALATAADRASDVQLAYSRAEASPAWAALTAPTTSRFPWDPDSTYLRPPPFVGFSPPRQSGGLLAKPLMVLGDDITTDHISPAGSIPARSEAGRHLIAAGADADDLNVYASRRGNWEVMVRGLFTNRTALNALSDGLPAGYTAYGPDNEVMPLWKAAQRYASTDTATVLFAGERYGAGSSRDWAAKGLQLLGVRAVLANSFERIHRSNLVGMGVMPLQLPEGWRPFELDLSAQDEIEIAWDLAALQPRQRFLVTIRRESGEVLSGTATALIETSAEAQLIVAGGMIPLVLDRTMRRSAARP